MPSPQNAFADRLGQRFHYFSLLAVDLIHEFELGVWKAVFIHLIRMLVVIEGTGIQELNSWSVFNLDISESWDLFLKCSM